MEDKKVEDNKQREVKQVLRPNWERKGSLLKSFHRETDCELYIKRAVALITNVSLEFCAFT